MTEKQSSSTKMAPYQQSRKGRRPIRVHNLLKKAQALKLVGSGAVKGSTKATTVAKGSITEGGKSSFDKLVKPKAITSSAEVGPLARTKKASVECDMIAKDPLIQYLKKHASDDKPPVAGLVDKEGILEDNIDNMPLGKEEQEISSRSPEPTPQMEETVSGKWQPYLDKMFENHGGIKKKYKEKDHAVDGNSEGQGVVKRSLGL